MSFLQQSLAGKRNTNENVKVKKLDEDYKSKIKLQGLLEEEIIRVITLMGELMEILSVL